MSRRPSASVFPILWAASFFEARPDVYLWEKVRPLAPFPPAIASATATCRRRWASPGLERLDGWTETTRAHARFMSAALAGLPGVAVPPAPADRVHVYYQYCVYVPDRDAAVRRCLRRGLDVEYHHMDVCPDLPLFAASQAEVPGARRTDRRRCSSPSTPGSRTTTSRRVAARLAGALDAPPRPTAAAAATGLPR